jgi:hypothetical protein
MTPNSLDFATKLGAVQVEVEVIRITNQKSFAEWLDIYALTHVPKGCSISAAMPSTPIKVNATTVTLLIS